MIMNKILIGSIIAVVILVLVSFTGVVGYQSTKSSTIAKASPLFTVRSSRAIDEESKDFTCDYVGKGEEITIPLPVRNNRVVLLEKIKDRISKMDVEEFNRFKNLIIDKLRNISALKETDITNEKGEQLVTGWPIPVICDDWTVSYPILCFLSDLYSFLAVILSVIITPFFLLFLLVYVLIEGDLPPTFQLYPMTFNCCHP